mmetsp:Transcript_38750/g.34317  ORF Transcript_38750/g.34317 Transcript_38750/m.34317 type:complete len:288 (+) Transcript_38750:112-975(+)
MNILTFASTVLIIFNSLISSVLSHTCVCAQFTKDECNKEANCCWNEYVPQVGTTIGIRGKCRSVKYLQCKANSTCHIKYNKPSGTFEQQQESSSFVTNKVAELVSAYNKLRKLDETEQSNSVDPTQGRVLDWPWACTEQDTDLQYTGDKDAVCSKFTYEHYMGGESGDGDELDEAEAFYTVEDNTDSAGGAYAADPVDVTEIEIAAQRLYYAKLNALEKTENNISSKPGKTYQAMSGLQIGAGIVFIILLFSAMCYWQCNKDKMDKDNKFISLSDDGNAKGTYSTFN